MEKINWKKVLKEVRDVANRHKKELDYCSECDCNCGCHPCEHTKLLTPNQE